MLVLPGRTASWAASAGAMNILATGDFGAYAETSSKSATLDLTAYDGTSDVYVVVGGQMTGLATNLATATLDANNMPRIDFVPSVAAFRPAVSAFKLAGTALASSSTLTINASAGSIGGGAYIVVSVPGSTSEAVPIKLTNTTTSLATFSTNVAAGDCLVGMRMVRDAGVSTSTWVGLTEQFDGVYVDITDNTTVGSYITAATAENVDAATPRTITNTNDETIDTSVGLLLVIS